MQFAPYLRATPETTDDDLVAAVRRGDDQAFERLYERYHRRIAAYIYGMVNDYGRAEDIAQDVFMSALRRMRETDRPIAFKPWVYEIAKNACIDQFRRSRRAEEVSYDAEEGMGAADYGRLVTTGPSPDVAVDTKMSLDHLCGAFGGLSDTHHQILVMRELEGLSYREIGERLGMSRPSVESTLFRARRRLGEEYEELISGERCTRVQRIITAAAQGDLGTRDQRKLAKHVAHCQACRREARMAGIEAGLVAAKRPPVRSRIAAFLPLPAFLRRRLENDEVGLGGASFGHHAPALAQWSAHLSATVDPAIAGWAKAATAAAAAAAVAVAGVGGGSTAGDEQQRRTVTPASAAARQAPAPGVPRVDRTTVGGQTAAAPAVVTGERSGGAAPERRDAARTAGELSATGSAPASPATVDASATDGTPSLAPVTNLTGSDPTGTATPRPESGEKDLLGQVSDGASSVPEVPVSAVAPTVADGGGATREGVEGTVTGTANTLTDVLAP